MGKVTGFKEYDREVPRYQAVEERIRHWREFQLPMAEPDLRTQGARCMDCGVPFCHDGCPLGNIIPDFNDHVFQGHWQAALEALSSTNNFPEFTGRVCPAPCESACVLGINRPPVAIKAIEAAIIERGFEEGWMESRPPLRADGTEGGHRGLGTCRAGGCRPAQPGRSCGDRLRARRPHRRPAALRHPRLQAREGRPGPPPGRHGRRGHHVPHRRARGRRLPGSPAPGSLRCRRAGRRLHGAARPRHPGPGGTGRAPRHGLPAPVQPPARR